MNINWNDWLDKFNILHIDKNPQPEQTENGLTFTAAPHILAKSMNMTNPPKPDLSNFMAEGEDGKPLFLPTPVSALNSHMSLDNMSGLYALRELYYPELELPISRWYKPHGHDKNASTWWLRPDVLTYFGLLNDHWFFKRIARKVLLYAAKLSCEKERGVTSGKNMWFDRFLLLSLSNRENCAKIGKEGLAMMEKVLEAEHGKNPMIDVVDIYFKHPEHPKRQMIREYYRRKGE